LFEALEDRCLLSCPPWNPVGDAPPIPDPPDEGDYTRPPVSILWECTRPNEMNVVLAGTGSSSVPDPADASFTLTVTVDVMEDWSFVEGAWVRTGLMGWAVESSVKNMVDWYEETGDRYVVNDAGEQKVERHYVLDKTATANGKIQVDKADWTAQYAADGTISEKRGFQSVHSHTIQEPANGVYETSDERAEFTGPVRYTQYERAATSRTFVSSQTESVVSDNLYQELSFAAFTDLFPVFETTVTRHAVTNRYPGGSPLLATGDTRTITTRDDRHPDQSVVTTDFEWHGRNYTDEAWLFRDSREMTSTKAVTNKQTNTTTTTTLLSLERTTAYRTAEVPEYFDFSLIDNRVQPAQGFAVYLEWDTQGWLFQVAINGNPAVPPPTTQGGWNALQHSYRQCYDAELFNFGNVPPDAYPPLAPGFPV
jgi:hypothetical protein